MSSKPVVVTLRFCAAEPDKFRSFLTEILPDTRKAKGCRYSHTYFSAENGEFLLFQEWDSLDDQQAYLKWRAARGDLERTLTYLSAPIEARVWERDGA